MNDDTAILNVVPADLSADDEPRDDSLAEELAKAAPKKWWNKSTIVLGAVVLLVGGFVGGLQAQKQWGTSSTGTGNRAAAFPGGGAGRYGGGAGAYGFPGGGNLAGGGTGTGTGTGRQGTATTAASGTTGTVKLVDGTTIYVQTPDGNVVTVKTDGKTTVSSAKKGKLSDVKAGQSVTVQGAAGADGTVTATSVTAQPK
ncbi:DUF5666 domain-containing protein [Paractinoplanes globisporus]|uniref:DUF5666 domain-containing protein n=1 Tax=Paractinoplanes globisporus TaxID=113565 RepID=A0ABW6WDF2_9ACTN|nr:DUF5666 domain-containing protein [Actinoplanes globisporus]